MTLYYKLDENNNVVPSSLIEWSEFLEGKEPSYNRYIGDDTIGEMRISTVFIGIYLEIGLNNKPLTFETMVFKNGRSIYIEEYSTYKEAEEGHKGVVQWVIDVCKELSNEESL